MKLSSFISGLTTGVVVGSAIYYTSSCLTGKKSKYSAKNGAGRALHAIGDIFDNIASGLSD